MPEQLATIWERVREELEASLPSSTFKLWLDPLRPATVEGTTLHLAGPPGVRAWVERRYGECIERALRRHTPSLQKVSFIDQDSNVDQHDRRPPTAVPSHPGHTFERFVIGNGNRLAHAACLSVAEMPGEAYNPLFLYGAPGLGKTHLLGAIAVYARRRHPELRVHHTTAERFTSDFVSGLRSSAGNDFKRRHREVDLLLIDDVQFLQDKAKTQEELFHTFNFLYQAGSQIVLSSDRPPGALEQLTDRLRDRFEWGLCVSLEAPDLRTRTVVLARLAAEQAAVHTDPSILRAIAARVPSNIRKLEGALTRVIAHASIRGEPLTAVVVDQALKSSSLPRGEHAPRWLDETQPTAEEIRDAVCSVLHLSADELRSPARNRRVVQGRQLAIYLTRELLDLSLSELERLFDRNRATILHSVRVIKHNLEPGSDTHLLLERIRDRLSTDAPAVPAR